MFKGLKRKELEFQNPIRSLYPVLLLVLVETVSNLTIGYIVAFSVGALLLFYNSFRLSRSLYVLLLEQLLLLTISLALVVWLYPTSLHNYKEHFVYSILTDVVAMFVLLVSLLSIPFVDKRLSKKNPKNIPYIRTNLGEYRRTAYILLFIFGLRIILFVFYYFDCFTLNAYKYEIRLQTITFVAILFVVVYEELKVWTFRKMLDSEKFLPIVDDKGKVVGREARSVVIEKSSENIHPLVRVYLLQDGKLYMQKKVDKFGNLLWDTVVSEYVYYGDDVSYAAKKFVKQKVALGDFELKFITKYLYADSTTKQMVYVFCIETENFMTTLEKDVVSEQWWSNDEIVKIENYSFDVFPHKVLKELKFLRMFTDLR
jgi:hypothetical protein